MNEIDYDAAQKAIQRIELDYEIPFEIEDETITVRIKKSEMDFLRLTHDDSEDIQDWLELILANGIGELASAMKGDPDHFMYNISDSK